MSRRIALSCLTLLLSACLVVSLLAVAGVIVFVR